MHRRVITRDPDDPYEYVTYCGLEKEQAHLKHKLTCHRLCDYLRRFHKVDEYSVEYWNELFEFFCIPREFTEKFSSIEQVKESLTIDGCRKKISVKKD